MAELQPIADFILSWEGGYVNDPTDRGGATNMGVTIGTWKKVGYDKNQDGIVDVSDLKQISKYDVIQRVMKPFYFDRWRASEIKNQSIALILVDWVWASGAWGIRIPQRVLNVEVDGIVGRQTIEAVNKFPAAAFFNQIMYEREKFINGIIKKHPEQAKFKRGWINRLKSIKYENT
jgi:lysozyme family protein